MVRRLERRGFPQLWGWLFVTLTVDAESFDSPEEAYEAGADRVRRMVHALRKSHSIPRYFSKFELTQAGWPHWHVGIDTREFIANDEIADAWGLGFTSTKRVKKNRDFRYVFKYVAKSAGEIPDWVLDYGRRIRIFQTSAGFYGDPAKAKEENDDQGEKRTFVTLRQRSEDWLKFGTLRWRDSGFRGVKVELVGTYAEFFVHHVTNGARALDAYHCAVTTESIQGKLKPCPPIQPKKQPSQPPRTFPPTLLARFRTVSTSSPALRSQLSPESGIRTERRVVCL